MFLWSLLLIWRGRIEVFLSRSRLRRRDGLLLFCLLRLCYPGILLLLVCLFVAF